MNNLAAAILGMGVITPRAPSLDAMAGACTALPENWTKETADIPPPEGMTARDQRRQARLTRLALYSADCAVKAAGVRGSQAGIYVGLTHGTTAFLKEFHDYLFDYGPEMASPNAFSNGVTNAPLGAVSLHQKLTGGGATLVGLESCGLDTLAHGVAKVCDGTHDLCVVAATEEYSPLVEDVYTRLGWYPGTLPPSLPWSEPGAPTGVGMSEGSVCCVLAGSDSEAARQSAASIEIEPLNTLDALDEPVDLVISGAGGGPQDVHELEALRRVLSRQPGRAAALFPKVYFGETFAVGPLLALAMAWDILTHGISYPTYPLHDSLHSLARDTVTPSTVNRILLIAASRDGMVSAGVVRRRECAG